MNTKVIVISGSMGSGKTTVLGEASDVLSACHIAHASVDLDAIGTAVLPDAVSRDLMYRNLSAIHANFSAQVSPEYCWPKPSKTARISSSFDVPCQGRN